MPSLSMAWHPAHRFDRLLRATVEPLLPARNVTAMQNTPQKDGPQPPPSTTDEARASTVAPSIGTAADDQPAPGAPGADGADAAQAASGGSPQRMTWPALWEKLGPPGLLGIAWTAMPAIMGIYLLSQLGTISDYLNANPDTGLLLYVLVFISAAGLGLLPTYSQAILGGWVFGFALGLPAALVGFTGASIVGYGVARFVARDRVEKVIASNIKARAITDALVHRGFWPTLGIVTLLRLPPNSPFALTNLAMASARTPLGPFALGTVIGMSPRTAVAVAFAAAASAESRDIQQFVTQGPGWMVFVIGLIVMFIVLGIIGYIANRALDRLVGSTT